MTEVKGVDQLKEHLERAKEHLSSTNETIKKYTGREPGAPGFKPNFRNVDSESAGRRIFSAALKRGGIGNFEEGPALKVTRRTDDIASKIVGVAYSRLETRRRERDIHDRLGPLRSSGEAERERWGARDREWNARDREWNARDREWGPRGRTTRRQEPNEPASGAGGGSGGPGGGSGGNAEDRRVIRRRPITLSSSITRPTDDFDDYTEPEPEPRPEPRPDPPPRRAAVTASVVRVPEQRSREDAIKEMKSSLAKDDKERNRRIFSGLLLGTLRNFNSQASRAEAVAQRRRTLEARIEERQQEEKADLKRERADLFRARRENQRMVRRIEQKIRSVDAFEAWKKEFIKQKHFIRTRAKPKIFYLPRILDAQSEKRLQRTSKEIDEEVTERRAKMEQEVAQLIEEEPQDPAQLLQETNRVRLTSRLTSKEEEEEEEEEDKAETAGKAAVKRDEEEDAARVDVAVFVGDEDEAAALEAVKRDKALEEVPLPAPVTVEVLADADIPLPPSPPPRPSSLTVPAAVAAATATATAAATATSGDSGGAVALDERKAKDGAQEEGRGC